MKRMKIKDNSQYKKDLFSDIKTITDKIADITLKQLESEGVFVFPELVKDAEDITQNDMIIQSVNDTYRSSNVMGFIGCGEERLIISSRFSSGAEDFFFEYLLHKVLDVPNIVNLFSDADRDDKLFNFLLFLFPAIPALVIGSGFIFWSGRRLERSSFHLPMFSNDLWILQAFETALLFFLFLYAIYYAAIRIDTEAYQLPFPQEITQAL